MSRIDDVRAHIEAIQKDIPWFEHVKVTRDGLGLTAIELNYSGMETLANKSGHAPDTVGACQRLLDRFQKDIDSARKDLRDLPQRKEVDNG